MLGLPSAGLADSGIFGLSGKTSSKLYIYGGEVICAIPGINLCWTDYYCSESGFYGLKFPALMNLASATHFTTRQSICATGSDGGLGNTYYDYYHTYSSRFDGYYPTLNARLELSTPLAWAYSIYPFKTTPQNPAHVALAKIWSQPAATKTITVELLWPVLMPAPTSANVWMTVSYTENTTGDKVTQSTQAFPSAALSASSAGWSSTTYGPTLFSKLKLSLTTATAIKQDTEVMVTFFSSPKSGSAADIIMLCPDPVFS